MSLHRIQVIDSHTGGEPTRVVIAGGPDLGGGDMAERRRRLAEQHDWFRSAVVNEPRGSDVLVGALLCEPARSDVRGRRHLLQQRRLPGHVRPRHDRRGGHAGAPGPHRPRERTRCETPVGVVAFDYDGANTATIENVPSYRLRHWRHG